jgi:hypothetical protein
MNRLFILLIFFSASLKAQNMEDSIVKKVNQNIVVQLSKIPVGSEKSYGFDVRDDFTKCIAGAPIRVMTLTAGDSLVELNEWRVPIIKDGKYRILFTVRIVNDLIEIVDLGGVKLAAELQTVINNNLAYHYMLRLFELHIDFVANCSDKALKEQAGFLPLESARQYIKNNPKGGLKDRSFYSISEVKHLYKVNAE